MLIGIRLEYGFEEDRLPFYTYFLRPRISTKLGRWRKSLGENVLTVRRRAPLPSDHHSLYHLVFHVNANHGPLLDRRTKQYIAPVLCFPSKIYQV